MVTEKKETKKTTAKKTTKKTTAPKAPKVKIEAPSDPMDDIKLEEAPEAPVEPPKYKVVCKSVLNVREGAGKAYRMIRQIPNGSSVSVYEQANGFGRIGDGEWVMMSFLKSI